MIRTLGLLALGLLPLPAAAQGISEVPRAAVIFERVTGYDDISEERSGPLTRPFSNELGIWSVMRLFRNVCIGIERGEPLDVVLPPGFAAFDQSEYYWGNPVPAASGRLVLSPTGSIDEDETAGHPALWISPRPTGTECRVEWRAGEMPDETQGYMAALLNTWLPYGHAAAIASRPWLGPDFNRSDFIEWDRPCGDRWCPLTTLYALDDGEIQIATILNITDIGGARP